MKRKPADRTLPDSAPPRARRSDALAWAIGVLAAIAPLWAGRALPFVDLPQHLYVISVLHRLHDATTLYPRFFELRPGLNPYLGYYYLVDLLHTLFPLELANRIFLSAYAAGFPLALAFLLRSLKRPAWPALLAVPFAYGDSLAWGFINYCAALPLTFLCLGLVVRTLTDPVRRARWAVLSAVSLLAVLSFHIQPVAYLALAIPFLLLTTRVPEDRPAWSLAGWFRPRLAALAAVAPGALTAVGWLAFRLSHPTEVAAGAPGKAWGPLLSQANLAYETFPRTVRALWWLPANMLRDASDRLGLHAVLTTAALAVLAALFAGRRGRPADESRLERARPAGLTAIAFGLFFALPIDIRGYMYYVGPRFVHVAAALLVISVPRLPAKTARVFLWLAAASTLATAFPLCRGFAAFDREAGALQEMVAASGSRPLVMGLMYDARSGVVERSVYLHSAAVLARARGGVPNFSFITAPYSPVRYRIAPPPALRWEWQPQGFDYRVQGPAYDHFLIRGADPAQVFGDRLGRELYVAAQSEDFSLVRRRSSASGP